MTGWASVGTTVVLLGIVLASPPVVFIGAIVLIVRVLAEIWPRRVLEAMEFRREVTPERTVVGEPVELRLSLWNRTRLPVAWASASDTISEGLSATAASSAAADRPTLPTTEVLRISGALRPYERVTRRFRVTPLRRGVHEIGPARIRVAELFGTHTPMRDPEPAPLTIIARPLTAPVIGSLPAQAPLARRRATRSLFADPNLFAGVRPHQSGDPMKSIHWRASARRQSLQMKRFEPSLSGPAMLVFDIQTVEGEYWMLVYDDRLFEDLCVATLSVARELVGVETACGFAAATFGGSTQRHIYLPPRADRAQLGRIADALARLTPESSAPLGHMLAWLPRRLAIGTMIFVLSARSPSSSVAVVRRLEQSGYPVHFLLVGGEDKPAEARKMGLSAFGARVETDRGVPRAVAIAG